MITKNLLRLYMGSNFSGIRYCKKRQTPPNNYHGAVKLKEECEKGLLLSIGTITTRYFVLHNSHNIFAINSQII